MKILGLQKTTLLDYPGCVAATIFLGGCNMRCPFCHNMNLVMDKSGEEYSTEEIFSFLNKRRGILEGVCVTGGEPTLYSDLPKFIREIKNLGYRVKLDTNGTNPQMLKELIDENLIDYIAMDIKSSSSTYGEVSGVPDIDIDNILESINIIMNSGIDYEFRTTAVNEYHSMEVMQDISNMIKGSKKYFLQCFVDSEYVTDHNLTSPDKDTLIKYKNMLCENIEKVEIRGI